SLLEADAAQAVARPREEPAVAAGEFQRALVALARGRELAPALVDAADLLEERGRARPREALRLLEGGEGLAVLADPRVEAAQLRARERLGPLPEPGAREREAFGGAGEEAARGQSVEAREEPLLLAASGAVAEDSEEELGLEPLAEDRSGGQHLLLPLAER